MQTKTPVEIADIYSRKRAILMAVAATAFVAVQVIAPPFFGSGPDKGPLRVTWVITAVLLLLGLATGGGLMNGRRIRSLVNDEVARDNYRTAIGAGFWVAMSLAIGLYAFPVVNTFSGRATVFVILTPTIVVALLTFAWLEYRAHRDA
jgi:MFS family permease